MKKKQINKERQTDLYELEKSLQIRQSEIDFFWRRAWFFGALLIGLMTAYISLRNTGHHRLSVCISFIIFLIALAQSLLNRGSKYWQERWEFKTKNRESRLNVDLTKTNKFDGERYYIDAAIRAKGENLLTRSFRFSVSKLTFLAWDLVCLLLFSLWVHDVMLAFFPEVYQRIHPVIIIGVFHLLIILYIVFFCRKGKVYEHLLKHPEHNKQSSRIEKYKTDAENYLNNRV